MPSPIPSYLKIKVGDLVQGKFKRKVHQGNAKIRHLWELVDPMGKVIKVTDKYVTVVYFDTTREDFGWGCAVEYKVKYPQDKELIDGEWDIHPQDFSWAQECGQTQYVDWHVMNINASENFDHYTLRDGVVGKDPSQDVSKYDGENQKFFFE